MFVSPEPLPVISAHKIGTTSLPPIDWVVRPLIAASERTVLYGEFGALKSWALLHMGLHIAAGRPWLGTFEVPRRRGVLYVDEEMSEYTLRARVKRLLAGMKVDTADMPFWATSRLGVRMTEIGAHILLDRIEKAGILPDIIMVEALRRVLVGDEKEATDVSAFWRHVEPIIKAGKCLIVSHHMRKPKSEEFEEDPRHRASGSTDILAGPDTGWALTRQQGADFCTMTCTKIRLAEEPKPFTLEFDFGVNADSPVTARVGSGGPHIDSQGGKAALLIKTALEGKERAETGTLLAICEAEGISRRTAEYAITCLQQQKVIHKVGHGIWSSGNPQEAVGE